MLKPHRRLYAAAFFLDFAMMSGATAVPFFIYDHLGGGARMSGAIMAAQALCTGLTCLISAQFVARARNGLSFGVAGAAGFGLILPLALLTRNPLLFGLFSVLGMACTGLFWPAAQAWIGAEPDLALRGRRIAFYNLSWSCGLALGPVFAGRAYDAHYWLPFVGVFVAAGVASVLVATLPSERRLFGDYPVDRSDARRHHDRLSDMHLYSAWLASMTGWALVGVMRSVFPKRVDELVAAGELAAFPGGWSFPAGAATQFSWLALTLYASRAGISLAMGRYHGWQHRFALLFVLQCGAAAAFLVLGFSHSLLVMAVCSLIVGVNGGASFFASLYYSVANPEKKHRRAAIHESMVGLGGFAGSIVFGCLAGSLGVAWPFRLTPAFVGGSLVLQWLLLRYGARRTMSNRM
jgi:MFS family permease